MELIDIFNYFIKHKKLSVAKLSQKTEIDPPAWNYFIYHPNAEPKITMFESLLNALGYKIRIIKTPQAKNMVKFANWDIETEGEEEKKMSTYKCNHCNTIFTDEEIDRVVSFESRGECWGSPCREKVVEEVCPNCGSSNFDTYYEDEDDYEFEDFLDEDDY